MVHTAKIFNHNGGQVTDHRLILSDVPSKKPNQKKLIKAFYII